MQLSDKAIKEYIEIYKTDFGEELSIEEAREIASGLVALYEVLCRPLPAERAAKSNLEIGREAPT